MGRRHRFRAELRPSGRGGGGHLIEVPGEVVQALGGAGRTPIVATFNGIPYRGSVVKMGGTFVLGVTKEIIGAAGATVGDPLTVIVERDTAERTVEIPPDLAEAMAAHPGSREAWDRLSFTNRKELARGVEGAKKPETRQRRIDLAIQTLISGR
jgi:hypothetical protein